MWVSQIQHTFIDLFSTCDMRLSATGATIKYPIPVGNSATYIPHTYAVPRWPLLAYLWWSLYMSLFEREVLTPIFSHVLFGSYFRLFWHTENWFTLSDRITWADWCECAAFIFNNTIHVNTLTIIQQSTRYMCYVLCWNGALTMKHISIYRQSSVEWTRDPRKRVSRSGLAICVAKIWHIIARWLTSLKFIAARIFTVSVYKHWASATIEARWASQMAGGPHMSSYARKHPLRSSTDPFVRVHPLS